MPNSVDITTPKQLQEIISGQNLTVVHFSAKWSAQCTLMTEVLTELSKNQDYAGVKFCKCEAEDVADICLNFKIEAVPTILLFQSGKVVDRVVGFNTLQLTDKVKKYAGSNCNSDPKESQVSLDDRLKQLINRHKVIIFMKGNRDGPRCGFSKQLIHIMNETGVEYDTFDILNDEEVRQGLKTYSDWPTYPQLYVNGELVGGLDIIKEMLASGDLETTLKS